MVLVIRPSCKVEILSSWVNRGINGMTTPIDVPISKLDPAMGHTRLSTVEEVGRGRKRLRMDWSAVRRDISLWN